ncbi:MAG: hypothetical protein RL365_1680 [Bacteroidota bacterium]|jgi:hypothetical protein
MKSILYLSFVLTLNGLFAQGNLQFNTVYSYAGNTSISTPVNGINYQTNYGTTAFTVPNGKIWRIERLWIRGTQVPSLFINNFWVGVPEGGVTFDLTSPIWLKTGDVIKIGSANSAASYHLNIVEFNLIP